MSNPSQTLVEFGGLPHHIFTDQMLLIGVKGDLNADTESQANKFSKTKDSMFKRDLNNNMSQT